MKTAPSSHAAAETLMNLDSSQTESAGELRYARDPRPAPAPETLPSLFFETAQRVPDGTALMFKKDREKEYRSLSYAELADRVRTMGRALIDLGVNSGDCVALMAENRPEWAITDLATLSIGGVITALYVTLTPPQMQAILQDSSAQILIVSDEKLLKKALEIRGELPQLKQIVMMNPPSDEARAQGVLSFEEVITSGKTASASLEEFERRREAVRPEHLASLIYTSGTTGEPKGARLTHHNFCSNARAVPLLIEIDESDLFLSFLPLCHIFERLAGHYLPLSVGATIAYSEGVHAIQRNMTEVNPTIMLSVPRLYESIQERILDTVEKASPRKKSLFRWAVKAGHDYAFGKLEGRGNPLLSLKHGIADKLVLSKVRGRLGNRLRYFISGGAPLPRTTAEFFYSLGVTILEGYGLTETSPVICVNRPEMLKFGTVGPPMPGIEVKIAEDGEILSRGPHIMEGYHHKPEDTRQVIDAEGWFHTGDIGRLDAEGRLSITDRKKDILVLANGKNVAPLPLEIALKASPYIKEAVLIGDRQNVVTALIVPSFDALKSAAQEQGWNAGEPSELVQRPEARKLIKAEIDRAMVPYADFERVRRFTLLDHEFSQDDGLLTPTLKVKRRAVMERYAKEIAAMKGE